MSSDSTNNQLPFRAGAMVLLAIAVICIGLGIYSLTKSDDDDDSAPVAATSTTAAEQVPTTDAAPPATTERTTTSRTAAGPTVCVLNNGIVQGLGQEVGDDLKSKDWNVTRIGNYQSPSVTENTVFYDPEAGDDPTADSQSAAEKLLADSGLTGSADARPATFTECAGSLVLLVVSR